MNCSIGLFQKKSMARKFLLSREGRGYKCLKMSKREEGGYVGAGLCKGLHFVKSYCRYMYGEIYQASV